MRAMGEEGYSRSQWNDGYDADSGPSRGDPCKRALRPTVGSKVAVRFVRNTSSPVVMATKDQRDGVKFIVGVAESRVDSRNRGIGLLGRPQKNAGDRAGARRRAH